MLKLPFICGHSSRNFQNFLFQAELAGMQMARLKRIAKDFDSFVKSAAINFEMASPGAATSYSQPGKAIARAWTEGNTMRQHRTTLNRLSAIRAAESRRCWGRFHLGFPAFPAKTRPLRGCGVQY